MTIKLKCYSALLLTASITLAGCQTTTTTPSKNTSQYEKIRTMQADSDLDGDGVLDAIDECPETPPNIVVDSAGCPVVVYTGSLEIEFRGFFEPMSSQLFDKYDKGFAIIEESLNEHPDAKVFIFGHMASNELELTHNKNNLSRNRAINVENRLVERHHIASDRISTYDCSDRYPFIDTDFRKSDFENMESKNRRVSVKASTQVDDLANLEAASDRENYERYSKHCEIFE
ncbi:OmpA family protein [Psychrobacter sp. GW64-MNA-CIBAN-0177]|jgi:OOP family OmpA-OmpF porin|uniref:OmpA family protein n=1 Tax=Psychrobacter sp. GW64-MNA-CIBAN-0177 TaxID=3140449 RepID=UPI00332E16E9